MNDPEETLRVRRRNWLKVRPTEVRSPPPVIFSTVAAPQEVIGDPPRPEVAEPASVGVVQRRNQRTMIRAVNMALALAVLFLMGSLAGVLNHFEAQVEATTPLEAMSPARQAPVPWPDLQFRGTAADTRTGQFNAVLNGFVVGPGGQIRGVTVVVVRPTEVVLAFRGESRVVYLGQTSAQP